MNVVEGGFCISTVSKDHWRTQLTINLSYHLSAAIQMAARRVTLTKHFHLAGNKVTVRETGVAVKSVCMGAHNLTA